MTFANQTFVITGASVGIGRGLARSNPTNRRPPGEHFADPAPRTATHAITLFRVCLLTLFYAHTAINLTAICKSRIINLSTAYSILFIPVPDLLLVSSVSVYGQASVVWIGVRPTGSWPCRVRPSTHTPSTSCVTGWSGRPEELV